MFVFPQELNEPSLPYVFLDLDEAPNLPVGTSRSRTIYSDFFSVKDFLNFYFTLFFSLTRETWELSMYNH